MNAALPLAGRELVVGLEVNDRRDAVLVLPLTVEEEANLLGAAAKLKAVLLPIARSERRRLRILSELEQIYAELDATAGPRGGGEGIAA